MVRRSTPVYERMSMMLLSMERQSELVDGTVMLRPVQGSPESQMRGCPEPPRVIGSPIFLQRFSRSFVLLGIEPLVRVLRTVWVMMGFSFGRVFCTGVYRVGTLLSSKFFGVSFEVLMLLSLP